MLATGPDGGDVSLEDAQAVLVERFSTPDTEAQDDWNNLRSYINPSYRVEYTGWNQWDYTAAERSGIRRWKFDARELLDCEQDCVIHACQ